MRAYAQQQIVGSSIDIVQPTPASLESIIKLDFGNPPIVEYSSGESSALNLLPGPNGKLKRTFGVEPLLLDSRLHHKAMAIAQETGTSGTAAKRGKKSNFIQQARQLHLYLGTFFAPAILFFSITGALQTFSFHERTGGSSYDPPLLLMKLAQLHKKQTLTIAPKKPVRQTVDRPAERRASRPAPEATEPHAQPISTLVMKWFTFLMAIGLSTTTLLGIYMAFKYNRDRRLVWGLLLVGTVLPTVIALL